MKRISRITRSKKKLDLSASSRLKDHSVVLDLKNWRFANGKG